MIFTKHTQMDKKPINSAKMVSSDKFRMFVLSKTRKTMQDILTEGSIRIKIEVADYE